MNCNRITTQWNQSRKFYNRTTNFSSSTKERLVEIRDTAAITSFVTSFGFFFYYLAEKLRIDSKNDMIIMKKIRFEDDFEENNKMYIDEFIEEKHRSFQESAARKARSDVDENLQRKFVIDIDQLYMELLENAKKSLTGEKPPSSDDEACSTSFQQKSVRCVLEQDTTEHPNELVLQIHIPSTIQRKIFDSIKARDFKILYKVLNDIDIREVEVPESKDKKQLIQQLGDTTEVNKKSREAVRMCVRLVYADRLAEMRYILKKDPSKKRELANILFQTGKFWQEEGSEAMYFYREAKNALTPEYEKDPLMSEIVRCMGSLFMDNGQILKAYSALCHAEKIASENSYEQILITMDKNRVFLETTMYHTLKVDYYWSDKAWEEANETKRKMDASEIALKYYPKEYNNALANMGRMAFIRGYKLFRRSELTLAQQYFNQALRKEIGDDSSIRIVKNDTPQQVLHVLENMPKSVIETNRDLAEIIFGLSEVYCSQGKKKIARRYLDLALPGLELTYGQNNPKLLDVYQRAARIYRDSFLKSVLVEQTKMKECCDKAIAVLDCCACSNSDWEMKKELFQETKKSFSLKLSIQTVQDYFKNGVWDTYQYIYSH